MWLSHQNCIMSRLLYLHYYLTPSIAFGRQTSIISSMSDLEEIVSFTSEYIFIYCSLTYEAIKPTSSTLFKLYIYITIYQQLYNVYFTRSYLLLIC